jgi:predicted metal-dependent enzyme (double-stranded beta helix superfamily)
MSHSTQSFQQVPAHVVIAAAEDDAPMALDEIRLLVRGQGTVGFAIAEKSAFGVSVQSGDWGAPEFRWEVGFDGVRLSEHRDGEWHMLDIKTKPNAGLDPDPDCPYWFSFDAINRALRYGKGEMRLGCQLAHYCLPKADSSKGDPYAWLKEAETVAVSAQIRGDVDLWRDPVTVELPLLVIPHDKITMEDIAEGKVTVPANLTPTCQILYDNVAGENFRLDTPDFPQFAQAIKESIADPEGWCHKTLAAKASEFGAPDPDKTYLRITLGQNQGDSPGVPFVMEIWPVGHYSPIHNHGNADAVIKVFHGEITVEMYAMLSDHHRTPFAEAKFGRDDVTWISPRLNQVHKLINKGTEEPCITIQCYMYAATNTTHWPYFDYLEGAEIAYFDPNSDADFIEFKAKMKAEWEKRHG